MNQTQLNIAAVAAKSGSSEDYFEVLKGIHDMIADAVDKNWNFIDDIHDMEDHIYNALIWNAIRNYKPDKGDFRPFFRMKLRSTIFTYRKRSAKNRENYGKQVSIEEQNEKAAEGNGKPLEVKDFLTDVHEKVEERETIKEKVALLAEGDNRKEMILTAWLNGYEETAEIARLLADKRGTKSQSERVFITRFKNRCQKAYYSAV